MEYIVKYWGTFEVTHKIEADNLEEADGKASSFDVGEEIDKEEDITDYSVQELIKLSEEKDDYKAEILSQSTY